MVHRRRRALPGTDVDPLRGPDNGDLVLWDTSHPYEAGAPDVAGAMVRAVVMQLPRHALPFRPERVDRLLARRIPAARGTGAVLAQFLGSVESHATDCGAREPGRLGTAALDLATTRADQRERRGLLSFTGVTAGARRTPSA